MRQFKILSIFLILLNKTLDGRANLDRPGRDVDQSLVASDRPRRDADPQTRFDPIPLEEELDHFGLQEKSAADLLRVEDNSRITENQLSQFQQRRPSLPVTPFTEEGLGQQPLLPELTAARVTPLISATPRPDVSLLSATPRPALTLSSGTNRPALNFNPAASQVESARTMLSLSSERNPSTPNPFNPSTPNPLFGRGVHPVTVPSAELFARSSSVEGLGIFDRLKQQIQQKLSQQQPEVRTLPSVPQSINSVQVSVNPAAFATTPGPAKFTPTPAVPSATSVPASFTSTSAVNIVPASFGGNSAVASFFESFQQATTPFPNFPAQAATGLTSRNIGNNGQTIPTLPEGSKSFFDDIVNRINQGHRENARQQQGQTGATPQQQGQTGDTSQSSNFGFPSTPPEAPRRFPEVQNGNRFSEVQSGNRFAEVQSEPEGQKFFLEEEQRRQEIELLKLEQEERELKKKKMEELKKKMEEDEKRRKLEEDVRRRALEEEERRKMILEEENKTKIEEEDRRRKFEEEKRKIIFDEERKRKIQEEEKRRILEEETRIRLLEEQRQLEAELVQRRRQEEEERKIKAEQVEKKRQEEEERKIKAELTEKKRQEEEERKIKFEEALRLRELEEKKKAEVLMLTRLLQEEERKRESAERETEGRRQEEIRAQQEQEKRQREIQEKLRFEEAAQALARETLRTQLTVGPGTILQNAALAVREKTERGEEKSSPAIWAAVKSLSEFLRADKQLDDVPRPVLMAIIQLTEFLETESGKDQDGGKNGFKTKDDMPASSVIPADQPTRRPDVATAVSPSRLDDRFSARFKNRVRGSIPRRTTVSANPSPAVMTSTPISSVEESSANADSDLFLLARLQGQSKELRSSGNSQLSAPRDHQQLISRDQDRKSPSLSALFPSREELLRKGSLRFEPTETDQLDVKITGTNGQISPGHVPPRQKPQHQVSPGHVPPRQQPQPEVSPGHVFQAPVRPTEEQNLIAHGEDMDGLDILSNFSFQTLPI